MTTAATADAVETKATPATAPAAASPATTAAPAGASAPAAVAAPAAAAGAATGRLLGEADPASGTKPAATGPTPVAPVAPVALKAAEGSTLSADDVKAVQTFATENGLTQAQAEKVLAREEAGRAAVAQRQTAEANRIADTWLAEAKAHPEIGGAKLDAAVANAKRALGAWATPEERKAIASSPFANNPLFLAILNRAAQALPVEDTIHAGATTAQTQAENPASVMYPSFAKR